MAFRINSKAEKSVRQPPEHPELVLGSRPESLRSPHIKPAAASKRNYGKNPNLNPDPASYGGAGFFNTAEPRGS